MSTIALELDGGVARVVLDRPRALNIYNLEMRDDLIEVFTALRDMPEVRAVVLAANGPHFSAGADLSEFGSAADTYAARRIRWRRDPWGPLLNLEKPTVAALHGYALGAGLEMALLCDFRLAAPDTVVGLPETKLAMLPSAGGSQTLTRLVGPARALPVVLQGENLSAQEAREMGVVHSVIAEVDAEAQALAVALGRVAPDLMRARLRTLKAARDLPGRQAQVAEDLVLRHYESVVHHRL